GLRQPVPWRRNLVVQGLVRDPRAHVEARRDAAELLRQLEGERGLPRARRALGDHRVAPGIPEELEDVARDTRPLRHPRTVPSQAAESGNTFARSYQLRYRSGTAGAKGPAT